MNPRRILRTGIAASAMVHLSALLLLLFKLGIRQPKLFEEPKSDQRRLPGSAAC